MKKILLILVALLLISNTTFAQGVITNPLGTDSFAQLLNGIIDWIINIALIIAPLIIVYGGVLFISSGGDPSKAATAKSLIFNACIGLIFALLAKTLVDVITNLVVK